MEPLTGSSITRHLRLTLLLLAAIVGFGVPPRGGATIAPSSALADPAAALSPSLDQAPDSGPAITAEVAWLYSSPWDAFVFVAIIRNATDRTFERPSLEWTAYDADGKYLQAVFGERLSPIGGHATQYFVGGVHGVAAVHRVARVDVTAGAGKAASDEAPVVLLGEDAQLAQVSRLRGRAALSYDVTATLTSPAAGLDRSRLRTYVILRDAGGAIVGADWGRGSSLPYGLPAILAPGTSVPFVFRNVPATAEAASGEVVGYVSR